MNASVEDLAAGESFWGFDVVFGWSFGVLIAFGGFDCFLGFWWFWDFGVLGF